MKILFATDGSVNADLALQMILDSTWSADTSWQVVAVAQPLHKRLNATFLKIGDLAERAQADLEKDLNDLLAESVAKLEAAFGKGKVSSSLLIGNPKLVVAEEAGKYGADLIIIGAHEFDIDDSWFSSVTRSLVINAPCSVQVMSATQTSKESNVPSKYLLAISDEQNAEAIVNAVLSRPWPEGSKFQVISVANGAPHKGHSRFFKSQAMDDLRKETTDARKKAAEQLVQSVAAKLKEKLTDAQITAHVLIGNPRSLLLQVAQDWPADMIFMGSHEQDHGVLEHFLGSTAAAVVWNAQCSVELVKLTKVKARV